MLTLVCAVLCFALVSACDERAALTEIMVRVRGDVPASDIQALTITVEWLLPGEARASATMKTQTLEGAKARLPLSFGVVPHEAARRDVLVSLELRAAKLSGPLRTSARTTFRTGESGLLDMYLEQACAAHASTCADGLTCTHCGRCLPTTVSLQSQAGSIAVDEAPSPCDSEDAGTSLSPRIPTAFVQTSGGGHARSRSYDAQWSLLAPVSAQEARSKHFRVRLGVHGD